MLFRSGTDHYLDAYDAGNNKLRPNVNITSVPDELKKD